MFGNSGLALGVAGKEIRARVAHLGVSVYFFTAAGHGPQHVENPRGSATSCSSSIRGTSTLNRRPIAEVLTQVGIIVGPS